MIRSKFIVHKVARTRRKDSEEITLLAHFDGRVNTGGDGLGPDVPQGRLSFTLTNPRFLGSFEPGQVLDITISRPPDVKDNVAPIRRAA